MLRTGMFLGDRYEILESVGSGGMADVYRAKCHKLNRMVAIKVLKSEYCNDKNFVTKFKAEAQAAAGLSHPNIVGIFDVGDEGEIHYIVMELVEGITLKQYIDKKKKLDIKESIGIAIQIAQGIGAAHEQHIIHRDIKPQNVIISKDGKVKVTDFGIAKIASSQTINSEAVGSVYYFSPEQARGGYCDERSDIYSLGITLYEMLTGRVPFDGESTVAVALAHLQADMTPPREIDPMIPISLEKIILKATMKKPERRYASAAELISDLRKALLMPEEDFVKVIPVNNTSPTLLISDDEISMIKQSKTIQVNDEDAGDSEGAEVEEYEVEEVMDPDEEDDEEESTLFDKVIFVGGILVCLLIICVAIFLLSHFIKDWSDNKETTAVTTETTTGAQIEIETTISDKQTTVPKVIGLEYDEAVALLKKNNLGVRRVDKTSEEIAEGIVIDQEYAEGAVVDKNISIKLYVSSGSAMVMLPDEKEMVGQLASNVKRTLRALGLEVVETTETSDRVQADYVISVEPSGGTKVDPGSTVYIVTSLGPEIEYKYVPDLRGMTVERAESYLDSIDTKLVLIVEEDYSDGTDYKVGQIMSQEFAVNDQVENGSEMKVTVSKGKEYVEIPDLSEMTEEEAKEALEKVGLVLGTVSEDYDDEVEVDLIIKYEGVDINADGDAKVGTRVNITISLGKEFAVVPDLTDMTEEEAEEALKEVELELGTVTKEYSDSVEEGLVISQGTDAETEVKIGSKVNIVISKGIQTVKLPSSILGRDYNEVKKELEKLEFVVTLKSQPKSGVTVNSVIECNYLAGATAPKGATVTLTYAVAVEATDISAKYIGGDKAVGESVSTSDFEVMITMNDGTTLSSGFSISPTTLSSVSNSIVVSYGSVSTTVTVKAIEPATEPPTEPTTEVVETTTEAPTEPETEESTTAVEETAAEAEGE